MEKQVFWVAIFVRLNLSTRETENENQEHFDFTSSSEYERNL